MSESENAIEEKKTEDSSFNVDYRGFAYNYLYSIIITIGFLIFIIGTLGLYTTKVAQANILPDNPEMAPYTIFDRVVKDIPIDINIIKPSFMADAKECMSQKALFLSQEYLDSFNSSFLCLLKSNAEPNSGIFANASLFLSKVYENIIAKNFAIINAFFVSLSYLPEWLIMMFYGFFGIIMWFILWFITTCLSIIYHIINIPELFKDPIEETNKWESNENVSLLKFTKLILFFFIWIPLGIASTFITPFFLSIYSIIAPLYAKYKIKNDDKNKVYGITDFIFSTFAYKKMFFFILSSVSLVMNGQKYLGSNSLIGIGIAIIFAYFMGFYSNDIGNETDGFSIKIRENIKQANVEDINMSNPKLVQICKTIPVDEEVAELLEGNGIKRNIIRYDTDNDNDNDNNNANNNDNNGMSGGGRRRYKKHYNFRLT
jgi:hypothetical protein